MYKFKSSPNDAEVGNTRSDDDYDEGPFNITRTKNAPIERLKRHRQAALVLNASRRFRYTLDLKKEEEEKQQQLRNVRAHAQAIRAAYPEKEAGQKSNGTDNLKKEEEKQKVAFLVQETGRYVGWH
ncbi:hypothetical protein ACOSQ3_015844 [Xanthoceras sorbifolium]